MSLAAKWAEARATLEEALEALLPGPEREPAGLHRAMRHSTLRGGKRLRGLLVMSAAEAVGGRASLVVPAAGAVELIHAYSLIHDDLPCMDDDDWRRGRPSTHRVYGEATALLAGDSLLPLAFGWLASGQLELGIAPVLVIRAVIELARATGSLGMAGGQAADLANEGRRICLAELEEMHRKKTGALITVSARLGGLLSGCGEAELEALTGYADSLGLAFQITDDLLDVVGDSAATGKPVGRDAEREKATYPGLLGVAEAQERALAAIARARGHLASLGQGGVTLAELAEFVLTRDR